MIELTYARVRLGWSKAQLARESKVDQSLISRFESGFAKPYPVQAARIADALGWDGNPSALFDEADD